ncbi:MAG: hypothetical protein LBP24_05000 [Coriobacteriales bacterium]|jgi:uncharacterized membrane protein|nr:hypothetical protein [Coriobacteriales bacterium]
MKRGWYFAMYALVVLSVILAIVAIVILPDIAPFRWSVLTGEMYDNGIKSKWFHIVFPVISILVGVLIRATVKPTNEKEWIITAIAILASLNIIVIYILTSQLEFIA